MMAEPLFADGDPGVLLSFEGIIDRVRDLDPKEYSNRDWKWIKEKSHEVRTLLNKIVQKIKVSGGLVSKKEKIFSRNGLIFAVEEDIQPGLMHSF